MLRTILASLIFAMLAFGAGAFVDRALHPPAAPLADTRAQERRDQIATLKNDAPIVLLGDSLTERGLWGELLPQLTLANRGVGGATVADMARDFTTIPPGAKTAVVMAGVNDFIGGATAPETLMRYTAALDTLTKRGLRLIVESTLLTDVEPINPKVTELNTGLKAYCATVSTCTWFDVNALLGKDGRLNPDMTLDGVHLAKGAYRLWADNLAPLLTTASATPATATPAAPAVTAPAPAATN